MIEKVIPSLQKNVGAAKKGGEMFVRQPQIAEHKLKRDVDVWFKMKKREYQQ